MKQSLLLFLFTGIILKVSPQRLDGEYTSSPGIAVESIIFRNMTRTFELRHSNCSFTLLGKGTYDVQGKRLTLYFEKKPPVEKQPVKQAVVQQVYPYSSYKINIHIVDNKDTTESVAYASVYLAGAQKIPLTDTNGRAVLNYPSSQKQSLTVSCALCETQTIPLDSPGAYNITIFMKRGMEVIELTGGEQYTYRITGHGKDWIAMKNVNEDGKVNYAWKYWKKTGISDE